MNNTQLLLSFLILTAGALGIAWLRSFPFREKKTSEPQRTAPAEVISRRVQSGNPIRSGRSSGMGYTYLITFRFADGSEAELYAYDAEYGALREGMTGTLTWKGPYFVRFDRES